MFGLMQISFSATKQPFTADNTKNRYALKKRKPVYK